MVHVFVCASTPETTNNNSHEINQLVSLYDICVMDEYGLVAKTHYEHLPKEAKVNLYMPFILQEIAC